MKKLKTFMEILDKVAKKNNSDIYNDLNPHLKDTATKLSEVVVKHGKFSQNIVGAHYVNESPFLDNGVHCKHCLFFDSKGSCSIVDGIIDEDGVCRFRVIPKGQIKE